MPQDDKKPGAGPVAVLSYDYWTRRFGRDPKVIGKTFRYRKSLYEIVGVTPRGFIGTEPGVNVDAFIPATMNTEALNSEGWSWFRIWVRPKEGMALKDIRQVLQSVITRARQQYVKDWMSDMPKETIAAQINVRVVLLPAARGVSDVQEQYRRPLWVMAILAALVLFIACANVANLLTAQAITRDREMALRVSIGAGRWRLIQLVLLESALLAIFASVLGMLFAWYSVAFVVSMLSPPEDPVRLVLNADWRLAGFAIALAISVTSIFGLAPAIRASSVKPISALKGAADPGSHRRVMNSLLAAQVAFCMLVLFVAGLFITTFDRLVSQPLGFSPDGVLAIETDVTDGRQTPAIWAQVVDYVRRMRGVQSASMAGWALMTDNRWTLTIKTGGHVAQTSPLCLDVLPGFFETMRIGLLDGRDFRLGDRPPELSEKGLPSPGVGIANEAFARQYFNGQNPIGRLLDVFVGKNIIAPVQIVGYVRNARYRNLRDPILPTLYVPISARDNGTLLVRTVGNPPELATRLRRQISRAHPGFRVRNITTQTALIRRHSITERLVATLSVFFASTALILAGMGLYSVLNYSVLRRRREIGIRMALGAQSADVVWRLMIQIVGIFCIGLPIGIASGLACERYIQALLFDVKATDLRTPVIPAITLIAVALTAALPPLARAVRIDPAQTLRSE